MDEVSDRPKVPKAKIPKDRRQDPIDWDTVTDDEILDRSSVFSYNVFECRNRLEIVDPWVSIILTHLYIDHILNEFLIDKLAKPEAFPKKTRRKYVLDNLELFEAMGWVTKEISSIAVKINKVHNDLSHSLILDISENAMTDIKNLFPSYAVDVMNDPMEDDDKKGENPPYWKYLAFFLILLDQKRQGILYRKYMAHRREVGLSKALINARRVLKQVDERSTEAGSKS